MYHFCFLGLILASILITSTVAGQPAVYIIRHGEKPDPEDSGLNADGFRRAERLRDVFGVNSTFDIGYIVAPRPNKSPCFPLRWSTQTLIRDRPPARHRFGSCS